MVDCVFVVLLVEEGKVMDGCPSLCVVASEPVSAFPLHTMVDVSKVVC